MRSRVHTGHTENLSCQGWGWVGMMKVAVMVWTVRYLLKGWFVSLRYWEAYAFFPSLFSIRALALEHTDQPRDR